MGVATCVASLRVPSMTTADIPQLRQLSRAEKVLLVQQLWDEIAAEPDEVPTPAWHQGALAEGLAEYETNPHAVSSWDEVKTRILTRL